MSIGNPIKRAIKRGIQYIAANLGPHIRNTKEPQLLILMYHRILPLDDERAMLEEPGMVVSPGTFEEHLITLSRYFEFVTLSNWLERKKNGQPLPAKSCAITFDDGWADNYEYAFPVLKSLNVPATIFLVAGMVGTTKTFWPEQLAQLASTISLQSPGKWSDPSLRWLKEANTDFDFNATPPTTEQITQLVAHAKQYTDEENYTRLKEAEEKLAITIKPSVPPLLTWEQISIMLNSGLVETGSHTCNHIRLNEKISSEVVEREILLSKQIIEQQTGRPVKSFCFPNGDYSEFALNLVKHNYNGAVTTAHGWNSIRTDNYLLQRIGVHQDITSDQTAFLGRISGWL